MKIVLDVYDEMLNGEKNVFKLPTVKAAMPFIIELTNWLLERFNRGGYYQDIALKVYMILPALFLQKPSKNSKTKDHCRKLDERMTAWKEGRIMDLFQEGQTIQARMTASKPRSSEDESRTFAKFINQGKVNAALKMLSDSELGIHKVNKELQAKHPKLSTLTENTRLNGPINHILPSYFDSINEAMIFKATTLIKGA